ncbi:MAG: hypothetical protein EOO09_03260 [Chitinophagaceae bacterium]|nr:MAG: hypothetical protein EOO09_03260 [Chitinophagaceae bacterium]
MLHYKKLEKTDHLLACCDPDPNPNDPGSGDCCYDNWTTDLTEITSRLKCATSVASHKQKHFDSIGIWYGVLKTWCDEWEIADQRADTLCRSLELFIRHLQKVCTITEKTVKAIEILFCMIRELYTEVDILKEKYDELYKCIKCLKQPELETGGIRECLDVYGVKLDAVIAGRDEIIAKVVLAIDLAYDMHDSICDKYGLKGILKYWKNILNCECEDRDDDKKGPKEPHCDEHGDYHCQIWPVISFPIERDHYLRHLRDQRDEAKARMSVLKKETDEANQEKSALQAARDGLTNAIQSVDSTGKCK